MTLSASFLSRRSALAALGAGAATAACPALAQSGAYPNKSIKLIVGYAPGGAVDMVARVMADMLAAKLNVPVIVDNVAGAAGVVAAQRVVSSAADGYTLFAGSSNEMAATGLVNQAQKYDPIKDFTPLGIVATTPVLLVAGPKVPVKTLDEFLALVKRQPGKYSYGSSGVGSTLHFAGELIKQRAGLFMTHIPYRGTAALSSDLVGGALDFALMTPTAAVPFIQAGRITALGVTSAQRLPSLPQVPALGESKELRGYELSGWFALAAPKGLPSDIAQRLEATLKSALADAPYRRRLEEGGSLPATGREEMARTMREDVAKYAELVKFAKISE
jgi:tripartite-type tricarboxylate transporter receptor subunit TctC